MDNFIGKNACYDVWPKTLRFLDKYAENNLVKSKKVFKRFKKVVKKVQVVAPKKQGLYLTLNSILKRHLPWRESHDHGCTD